MRPTRRAESDQQGQSIPSFFNLYRNARKVIPKAAAALGITFRALRYKLKKLGID